MELPPNYLEILQRGINALLIVRDQLNDRLERGLARPEEELTLRDAGGLAARLEATSPGTWQTLWAASAYTGQDIGVLTALIAEYEVPSSYRDDPAADARQQMARDLRGLRDFLDTWEPARLTTDIPADYNSGILPEVFDDDRDQQQN